MSTVQSIEVRTQAARDPNGNRSRLGIVGLGAGVAEFGDVAFIIGVTTLLFSLADSATLVGFGMAAYALGSLAGAALGGSLIDRLSPRSFLLWGNVGGGVLVTSFALVSWVPALVVLIFAVSMASRSMLVAQQSCLPLIDPDNLLRVNSLVMACRRSGQLFGPAAAGGMVAVGSGAWIYPMNGTTFVVNGVVGFIAVSGSLPPRPGSPRPKWGAIRYSLRTRAPRSIFFINCVVGLLTGAASVSLVVYVSTLLEGSPSQYGLLVTFSAVGAILGTITATAFGKRIAIKYAAVTTIALAGASLLALPWVESFAVAAGLRVVSGWSLNVLMILLMANLHSGAPADLRGRVTASTRSGLDTLMIITTAGSGTLIAAVGVRPVLIAAGAVGCLCALVTATASEPFDWSAEHEELRGSPS